MVTLVARTLTHPDLVAGLPRVGVVLVGELVEEAVLVPVGQKDVGVGGGSFAHV